MAADCLDAVHRLDHRPDVEPAVGAPVAAKEHHRHGALREQGLQADERPGLVRQQERRHRFAGTRRVLAAAIGMDASDQPIDRLAIGRKDVAARRGIGIEPLA